MLSEQTSITAPCFEVLKAMTSNATCTSARTPLQSHRVNRGLGGHCRGRRGPRVPADRGRAAKLGGGAIVPRSRMSPEVGRRPEGGPSHLFGSLRTPQSSTSLSGHVWLHLRMLQRSTPSQCTVTIIQIARNCPGSASPNFIRVAVDSTIPVVRSSRVCIRTCKTRGMKTGSS